MSQAFIEVNPYHEITLYYYHANLTGGPDDVVLGHERLASRPLFADIPGIKRVLSLGAFVRVLASRELRGVHFNTINWTLTPVTTETMRLGLTVLTLSCLAKLRGVHVSAIMHEADHFVSTGIDSGRRAVWFRRCVGQWWIRIFNALYVLSPEVQRHVLKVLPQIQLLNPAPLSRLGPQPVKPLRRTVAWLGPVMTIRRSWRMLAELNPAVLKRLEISIEMLCDIRENDGPALRATLQENGLLPYFILRDYRPDDYEVTERLKSCAAVLCLYGGLEYGTIKTSGARIFAQALGKPFIANTPTLGVFAPDGTLILNGDSLEGCLEAALITIVPASAEHL